MKNRMCFKKAVAGISAFAVCTSAMAPMAPVSAAVQMEEGSAKTGNVNLTKDSIAANDYVLYTVNCGTPDPSVVPNQESERMGLLQSNVDQSYGADENTGTMWGIDSANEFSDAVKSGTDATDMGSSFVYMSDSVNFDKYKSALGYSFEVPEEKIEGIEENIYEVTVCFKHYWDNRRVNIILEGETVATDVDLNYGEWVSRTFRTTVSDGELNVEVRSPRRTSTKEDPLVNFIKVRAVEEFETEIPNYTSFTGVDGAPMYDTNGNQIQAHGGQIQQLTVDGKTKWYWIGEDKTNDYRPCGGIHMYSSDDLYNWDDEGVVLRTMESPDQIDTDPYFRRLYGDLSVEEREKVFIDLDKNNCVMERPKMLYNEKTQKYVIWFHADGRTPDNEADYGKAKAGIAVGDSPSGPFTLLGSYKLNYHNDPNADHGYDGWNGRGSVRDMNLFKDDDGTAYVIYSSEGNKTTFISRLNEEYTGLAVDRDSAVEGKDFTRNFVGWSREAPAMFKYKEKYYIVNSGCTGWSPNPAEYAVADNPLGPWTAMGDPCTDWGSNTTYDTQSTCVFPVDAENGKYIYMGDRWNSWDLSESRYVWVPVEFQPDNKIALRRYANWTLEDLKGKGLFEVITELPETVKSFDDISGLLPGTVEISYGSEKETTPVTWDMGNCDADKIGTVTITGTLTEKNRTFTHQIQVVNPKTLYFFDSGADYSLYHEVLKTQLGSRLLNDMPDQKYTGEVKAGYLGVTETEDNSNFDMSRHGGGNMLETGWWAADNKNIEYAFDLEAGEYSLAAGFQEWWNVSRDMNLKVTMGDTVLCQQDFRLESTNKDLQVNQSFTVSEAGTVKVSVSKRGDSDPVLSWIGIMGGNEMPPADQNDLTSLKLAVTMAEKMEAEQAENHCYTQESWKVVEEALGHAKEVLNSGAEVTQEQVDQAFLKLITACNLVDNNVQKVGLKAAIEGTKAILADTGNLAQYKKESIEAVRKALEAAELVYNTDGMSQETVNNETTRLLTAVTSMLAKEEHSRLEILIQKAEELLTKEDQYTPSSVLKLKEALKSAKEINANDQADDAQLKQAYDTLAESMTGLVRKANKDELKNALDKAEEILENSAKYLEESIAGLRSIKDKAQAVYDDQEADEDSVGVALKTLIEEILKARLMGDVNLNGIVDTADSAEVLKSAAELEELNEEQKKVADVNYDGAADSGDAAAILQYAAEKRSGF